MTDEIRARALCSTDCEREAFFFSAISLRCGQEAALRSVRAWARTNRRTLASARTVHLCLCNHAAACEAMVPTLNWAAPIMERQLAEEPSPRRGTQGSAVPRAPGFRGMSKWDCSRLGVESRQAQDGTFDGRREQLRRQALCASRRTPPTHGSGLRLRCRRPRGRARRESCQSCNVARKT